MKKRKIIIYVLVVLGIYSTSFAQNITNSDDEQTSSTRETNVLQTNTVQSFKPTLPGPDQTSASKPPSLTCGTLFPEGSLAKYIWGSSYKDCFIQPKQTSHQCKLVIIGIGDYQSAPNYQELASAIANEGYYVEIVDHNYGPQKYKSDANKYAKAVAAVLNRFSKIQGSCDIILGGHKEGAIAAYSSLGNISKTNNGIVGYLSFSSTQKPFSCSHLPSNFPQIDVVQVVIEEQGQESSNEPCIYKITSAPKLSGSESFMNQVVGGADKYGAIAPHYEPNDFSSSQCSQPDNKSLCSQISSIMAQFH